MAPSAIYSIVLEGPISWDFPYWAMTFEGKEIIYHKEDEIQEKDSEFLLSETCKEQSFFQLS